MKENFENKESGAERGHDFKAKMQELYEREKNGEVETAHFYQEKDETEFKAEELTAEDEAMWRRIEDFDMEAEGEERIMEEFNQYRTAVEKLGNTSSEKLASYLTSRLTVKMFERE